MNINIQSINFVADKQLKEFINRKVNKLISIKDSVIKANIYLKIDKPETYNNKFVEIKIHTSDGGFFAKKQSLNVILISEVREISLAYYSRKWQRTKK